MTITTTDPSSSYHDRISNQLGDMTLILATLVERIDQLRRLGAPLVIDLDGLIKLGQSVQAMHQEMIRTAATSAPILEVESARPKKGKTRKPRPRMSTSSTEDWCVEDLEFSPEDFL